MAVAISPANIAPPKNVSCQFELWSIHSPTQSIRSEYSGSTRIKGRPFTFRSVVHGVSGIVVTCLRTAAVTYLATVRAGEMDDLLRQTGVRRVRPHDPRAGRWTTPSLSFVVALAALEYAVTYAISSAITLNFASEALPN